MLGRSYIQKALGHGCFDAKGRFERVPHAGDTLNDDEHPRLIGISRKALGVGTGRVETQALDRHFRGGNGDPRRAAVLRAFDLAGVGIEAVYRAVIRKRGVGTRRKESKERIFIPVLLRAVARLGKRTGIAAVVDGPDADRPGHLLDGGIQIVHHRLDRFRFLVRTDHGEKRANADHHHDAENGDRDQKLDEGKPALFSLSVHSYSHDVPETEICPVA